MFDYKNANDKVRQYVVEVYGPYYRSAVRKLAFENAFDSVGNLKIEYRLSDLEKKAILFVSQEELENDVYECMYGNQKTL